MSYTYWNRNSDPARGKGAYTSGRTGSLTYPQQVAAYNIHLYQPQDTQQRTAGASVQTGPGSYVTPYGTDSVRFQPPAATRAGIDGMYGAINPSGLGQMNTPVTPPSPFRYVPTPTMGGFPYASTRPMGSGGFSFGATANPTAGRVLDVPSTVTRIPSPTMGGMPGQQDQQNGLPPLGIGTGVGNSMQRWNNGGAFQAQKDYNGTRTGMRQPSPQAQFFDETGRVDAHAYQANPANNVGAITGTFDPGGAHMPDRSFQPPEPHQDPANPSNTYLPAAYGRTTRIND